MDADLLARIPGVETVALYGILHVVCMRADVQVARVATRWIVAVVESEFIFCE